MLLSELIDAFKSKYKFECIKRNTPDKIFGEKIFNEKFLMLLLSEAVSDIQKSFDVISLSSTKTLTVGIDNYDLTSSVMEVKNVAIGTTLLTKQSTDWFEHQIAESGTPEFYTILYSGVIPKIWIYPSPDSNDNDLIVNYVPNFNLYSPSSADVGDFGDFGITNPNGYTGNTIFPTQYDKLMLLGMLKQVFTEIVPEYEREKNLLLVKQYNGEKFDYNPNWGE